MSDLDLGIMSLSSKGAMRSRRQPVQLVFIGSGLPGPIRGPHALGDSRHHRRALRGQAGKLVRHGFQLQAQLVPGIAALGPLRHRHQAPATPPVHIAHVLRQALQSRHAEPTAVFVIDDTKVVQHQQVQCNADAPGLASPHLVQDGLDLKLHAEAAAPVVLARQHDEGAGLIEALLDLVAPVAAGGDLGLLHPDGVEAKLIALRDEVSKEVLQFPDIAFAMRIRHEDRVPDRRHHP